MIYMIDKLCNQIVESLRYLHERVSSTCTEPIHSLYELMPLQEGISAVHTLQLLSRDDDSRFAVYRDEGAKILTNPSEIFAHQCDIVASFESARIEDPRLSKLIDAMETLMGPDVDIHGTQFVQAGAGKSISLTREKTKIGETIGFSFQRSPAHNYYLSVYPEQKLTIAENEKITDKIIEEADIAFIRAQSKVLIDWAYKVVGR